jgi:hypothetical protein
MVQLKSAKTIYCVALAVALAAASACAPMARPTLSEVRAGQGRDQLPVDTTLQPGEIRAEVVEIDPSRRELRVQTDDGRRQVLDYDASATRVFYHAWEHSVEQLEPGDIIAFQTVPRDINRVEIIRIQEPVQIRPGRPAVAQRTLPPRSSPAARPDVVEGTVERIQYDLGVFDVRPRTGKTVTVSIPYNARPADVDNFRRLRRGDHVRVEGEFVNSDNLQLLSFLESR